MSAGASIVDLELWLVAVPSIDFLHSCVSMVELRDGLSSCVILFVSVVFAPWRS